MYAQELVAFTDLLQGYYARTLNRMDPEQWRSISSYAEEPAAETYPAIKQAILELASAPDDAVREMRYDFNALFVGPEKLLAAPYETVYVSSERILMQHATLSVREAYAAFGMQVDSKNVEPDDHFAYEFAFLSLLLRENMPAAQEAFEQFVANHLAHWVPAHVGAVRENSTNAVCRGFADLLEAVYDACAH